MANNKHLENAVNQAKQEFANGNMSILCGILACSSTYVYNCLEKGEAGLPLALKLENLTGGKYTWRQLSPKTAKKVDSVKSRI